MDGGERGVPRMYGRTSGSDSVSKTSTRSYVRSAWVSCTDMRQKHTLCRSGNHEKQPRVDTSLVARLDYVRLVAEAT